MAPIPTTLVADLYTVAKFFIKLFLLRLTVLLRSDKSRKLLDFVNENYPPTHYYSGAAAAECSVCLADFAKGDAVRKLRCGHCFHRSCVDRWFEELGKSSKKGGGGGGSFVVMTCPLCRSGVVSPPGGGGERRLREEEDDRQEWGQRQLVVLLSSLRVNLGRCSITRAELRGILVGLDVVWEVGIRKVAVQVDSRVTIALIYGVDNTLHQHASEVSSIRALLQRDWEVTISHVYREGNYAADYLADIGHSFPPGFHSIDISDCTFGYFLRRDCMGIAEPRMISS